MSIQEITATPPPWGGHAGAGAPPPGRPAGVGDAAAGPSYISPVIQVRPETGLAVLVFRDTDTGDVKLALGGNGRRDGEAHSVPPDQAGKAALTRKLYHGAAVPQTGEAGRSPPEASGPAPEAGRSPPLYA